MTPPWDVLAIPSRGRADVVSTKTLPMLVRYGLPLDSIDIWVHQPEVETYRAAVAPFGPGVSVVGYEVDGALILPKARNAIASGYPVGTRLLEMDDDLSGFIEAIDSKTLVDADLGAELAYGWELLAATGLGLFSVAAVPNPYFMRREVSTGLRYAPGGTFGFVVAHRPDIEHVRLPVKEDRERSIRFFIGYGGLVRLNYITFQTKYYEGDGGLNSYRTVEVGKAGAFGLHEMFPAYTSKPKISKGRGQWECALKAIPGPKLPPRRQLPIVC